MEWLNVLRARLRALFRRESVMQDIEEELRSHVEMATEANIERGLAPKEARVAALKSFGNPTRNTELGYDVRGGGWLEDCWQDLRYGARMLRRQSGFTLIAVLTLALGIGATTAIFSVVNAVLLRPLPFSQPEHIVRLWEIIPTNPDLHYQVRYANYQDWRQQNHVFTHLSAYREDGFNLQTGAEPRRVNGVRVTVDFFNVLGVQPMLGRAFSAPEDAPGGEHVVILSHALWQEGFGGDAQLVGRQLKVDGLNHTVVGIMPPGFSFPNEEEELWVPFALEAPQAGLGRHWLKVLGRLQPEATVEQARAEFNTIAQRLELSYPATNKGHGVFMQPWHEYYSGYLQQPLYTLLGAVLFVLLIACANVANMLIARNAAREREIATRAALGAGRARLIRQLLTESLLLVAVGGTAALPLAAWGVGALTKFGPRDIPRLQEATIDARVLAFTLLLSALTGLIFGLAPAWRRAGLDLNAALKAGGRTAGGTGQRLRQGLVVAEVALALLLLVGAGLMLKSFVHLQQVAPGFDAQGGLTMDINLPPQKYAKPAERAAFLEQALARLRALPGVEYEGATHRLPFAGNSATSFDVEGRPVAEGTPRLRAIYRAISPDYFRAMGTPLVAGRTFTDEEAWHKPTAVIINQTLARRYWPNENPLGKRLKVGARDSVWVEIIGVAPDTKETELTAEVEGALYQPYIMSAEPAMSLVLRTGVEPLSLADAARAEIRRVDAEQAVSGVNTLEGLLSEATAQPRFNASLLALFALLALTLAAVGIYGVIAYAVAQRTQEIGLRMALGAQPRDVLRLILGQGLMLTLSGVGLGLLSAFALTRWLKSLLFGVSATDPLTFGGIALMLTFVALLACWIPARRAAKVDPIVALRYE
jgi:putative ABC transport system permease protein